jgi:hypothetical protein
MQATLKIESGKWGSFVLTITTCELERVLFHDTIKGMTEVEIREFAISKAESWGYEVEA